MVIKEQKLILVRGIPGSGKSTHAKALDAKLVEADKFFIDKDGRYQHDSAYIKDAHNWCKLETKRLLKAGFNVVVANTFVKNWEMKFYQNLANEMGLVFEVIEMKGNYQNIHGVPDSVVTRMTSQFETLDSSFGTAKRCYAA